MNSIYRSPFRVYLALLALAICGIVAGMKLPVSLFPNSSKPIVNLRLAYPGMTAQQFYQSYGRDFESSLKNITFSGHSAEKVSADYRTQEVRYWVEFEWNTPPQEAVQESANLAISFANQFPKEIRDSLWYWSNAENSGFLAIAFFSSKRSPTEIFRHIEPILSPHLARLKDAEEKELWNPERKEIRIELNPEKMANFQIFPKDVETAVDQSLQEIGGGTLNVGLNSFNIRLTKTANELTDLQQTVIRSRAGHTVYLREISQIDYAPKTQNMRIMKTSGKPSLMLWVTPRAGGNVKKLADDAIQIVKATSKQFPKDIQYRILVDPSEFIGSAVRNVAHEVFVAAFLAVLVLFLFLGNIKNVITASIEIPMSIILAFIMMKLTGLNLNLISLGGLALSAGMNVDASVVVMENIFRHFARAENPPTNPRERLQLILKAVNEVKLPIVASTISSLVVFIPLIFTNGLANAILGDLALAVIYSHGLSALVALVLVPTVRLHILNHAGSSPVEEKPAPLNGLLLKLENLYENTLRLFLQSKFLKATALLVVVIALAALSVLVLPKIPREIIGRPDSDWVFIGLHTDGHTLLRQMEEVTSQIENRLMLKHGEKAQYTFTQIYRPNDSQIMVRLKDKSDMTDMLKTLENEFQNRPDLKFNVFPWNPSELPIPDPPNMRLVFQSQDRQVTSQVAREILDLIDSKKVYHNTFERPPLERQEELQLSLNREQWSELKMRGMGLSPYDLSDMTRVATDGRTIGEMLVDNSMTNIRLYYPESRVKSVEDLSALPIGLNGKLLPLRAFARMARTVAPSNIYREDGRELFKIEGRLKKEDESKSDPALEQVKVLVTHYTSTHDLKNVSLQFEDAQIELTNSLKQLGIAIGLSILLIFFTMIFQFGDIVSAMLVLMAIPLGIIGVIVSLFVFKSTLSLNSALGVILLNGISVANSIILVDYLRRLAASGCTPVEAAVLAGRRRLRPILMTSLTTLLGMLPIALGLGEGGRILQPLGVAVAGGLLISTLLTLYIVPALQCDYLKWRMFFRHKRRHVPDVKWTLSDKELHP